MPGELAVDQASEAFKTYERELRHRGTTTTRSREDALRVSALVEAWFRSYRPALVSVLGEAVELSTVDHELQVIRAKVGQRIDIQSLRASLRIVARALDAHLLPSYAVARWTTAAAPQPASVTDDGFVDRLGILDPGLADSFQQALTDLEDGARLSYVGPAGEIREVFREVIHRLAPDDDVRAQPWYVGHDGRPTQAERIRYVHQGGRMTDSASDAAEMIDIRVGQIGRSTYTRASRAFHSGTEQTEVRAVLLYVKPVINEVLPPLP